MKKKQLSWKELAWYIAGGMVALFGVALMVFGIIGHHIQNRSANFVKDAEEALIAKIKINLDFRMWGIIFLALGMFVVIVALNYFAKKVDRENEKTIRRQQRLSSSLAKDIEVKDAVQIIEEPAAVQPEKSE